jgi:hypothetical protein
MSQTQSILSHLKRHRRITPLEALRAYRCFRLAARIQELRESGHNIVTRLVHKRGATYAEYNYKRK